MKPESTDDVLAAELRALGRSVPTIEPEPAGTDLAAAVLARLADVPPPSASRWQVLRHRVGSAIGRRRRILVLIVALLFGGLGVPGVRAAVIDWFTFDGVKVHLQPAPGPSTTEPSPPPTAHGGSLDRARTLVAFRPVDLPALGPPDGVEVSTDHRLLSLTWNDANGTTARLDEFDGTLDYVFAKTAPGAEWTSVAGVTALWFEQPHEVVILDAAGNRRTETARLAGHTLIWELQGTVLRLEGDFTRDQAIEIAESAELLP
ncbi:MAG TPA: hypothetical protein VLL08_04790 [Kineosporiaceae bacterium]|nr:hypothetical protein [Kineosporiaceae bacterium]